MKRATKIDDTPILTTTANHPICGPVRFERVTQDRRTYYRMTGDRFDGGSLTDASHALATVEYWRSRGWVA